MRVEGFLGHLLVPSRAPSLAPSLLPIPVLSRDPSHLVIVLLDWVLISRDLGFPMRKSYCWVERLLLDHLAIAIECLLRLLVSFRMHRVCGAILHQIRSHKGCVGESPHIDLLLAFGCWLKSCSETMPGSSL